LVNRSIRKSDDFHAGQVLDRRLQNCIRLLFFIARRMRQAHTHELMTDMPVQSVTRDKKHPIRVAALIDAAGISGPARQLAALAAAAKASDMDLTLVLFHRQGHPVSPYRDLLDRTGIGYRLLTERHAFDLRIISACRQLLEELDVDLLETHGYKPTALAWALRQRGVRLPWLAFFHGATSENIKIRFYNWLDRQLMRSTDRIAVMSRPAAEAFEHLGPPVEIIYNAAIPLAEESGAEPLDAAFPPKRDHPRLGVIARLSPEKGVDLFLEAAQLLHRRGVAFSALIIGDGPDRGKLEAQCARLGIGPMITFVGHQRDMRLVYRALDLLVIPSRSEGLPNVLLESLHVGVPVVATAVGGVPEVLEDPRSGVVVPPGDPGALAEGVIQALTHLNDPEWQNAARTAATRFSLAGRIENHRRVYQALLGRSSEARSETLPPVRV
jgi:glycosyltransferase involved in cell wall biosynthesis